MKNLFTKNKFHLSIILFGAFAIIGLFVFIFPQNPTDRFAADLMRSLQSKEITYFMAGITNSYQDSKIVGLLLVALLLLRKYVIVAGLAVGIFINSYLTSEAKNFFGRSRPEEMLINAGGKSYPSGHSSSITIISFFVIWAMYVSIKKVWMRNVAISCVVIYTVLIMVSRMYLNVHWFTDVIGGFLLATAIGFLIVGFIEKETKHK